MIIGLEVVLVIARFQAAIIRIGLSVDEIAFRSKLYFYQPALQASDYAHSTLYLSHQSFGSKSLIFCTRALSWSLASAIASCSKN